MKKSRLVPLFTLAAVLIIIITSFNSPKRSTLDISPEPSPPPPLEELIPEGLRSDNSTVIRVLSGDEVTDMTLEMYLIGVVAAEMPALFGLEALKAQSVAARTNVLYRTYVSTNARHPDALVCTDFTCCMAFQNDIQLRNKWDRDYVRNIMKIIDAVIGTDGVYITYDDRPILAVFHSSSNGKTETSGNVWVTDLPYLLSVDSPENAANVPDFTYVTALRLDYFVDVVTSVFPDVDFSNNDRNTWITDIKYTESGRVLELVIGGVTVRGTALRSLFSLRSTAISIELIDDDIIFTTTGFGHGVGMSQYGANVMAERGMSVNDILNAYYTGVSLMMAEPF